MASSAPFPGQPLAAKQSPTVTSDLPRSSMPSHFNSNDVQVFVQPKGFVPPPPRFISTTEPPLGGGAGGNLPTTSNSPTPTMYSPSPVQYQPSPSTGIPGRPRNRPSIMEPPGLRISHPIATGSGFPSPSMDHAAANVKFTDDMARITYAIQQSLGQSVRRAVRDNWEKCLLGSDFHQGFVLNASIHNATTSMIKRSIRGFGSKMVKAGKDDLLEHFSQADLDAVADTILAKASHSFLDKALELRLRTIEAQSLVDALSRAERLGYESNDVVEEDDNHQERVIPSDSPPATYNMGSHLHTRGSVPGVPTTGAGTTWQCSTCFRTFAVETAYNHHTQKQVCTQAPSVPEGFRYSCSHCGQGFTTPVGLQYHLNNKICGDFGPTPAEQRPNHPGAAARGPPNHSSQVQYNATMTPQRTAAHGAMTPSTGVMSVSTANAMSKTISGIDPYAHLTLMQREALKEELRQAEIVFANRFKLAQTVTDPNERRIRIEGLRNSFGTKQSNIRKRYGVRLRERRTKAEIKAERERMGRQEEERYGRGELEEARKSQMDIDGNPPRFLDRGRPPDHSPSPPRTHLAETPILASNLAVISSATTTAIAHNDSTSAKHALDVAGSARAKDSKRRRVEDGAETPANGNPSSAQRAGDQDESMFVSSGSDSSGSPDGQLAAETTTALKTTLFGNAAPATHPVVDLDDDDDDEDNEEDDDEDDGEDVVGGNMGKGIELSDDSDSDNSDDDDEGIPAVLPATMSQGLTRAN